MFRCDRVIAHTSRPAVGELAALSAFRLQSASDWGEIHACTLIVNAPPPGPPVSPGPMVPPLMHPMHGAPPPWAMNGAPPPPAAHVMGGPPRVMGTVKLWNVDKGFGFIVANSAFRSGLSISLALVPARPCFAVSCALCVCTAVALEYPLAYPSLACRVRACSWRA